MAFVMRNTFNFTRQQLLWCLEEMQAQHAAPPPTNTIKSVPLCIAQLVSKKQTVELFYLVSCQRNIDGGII